MSRVEEIEAAINDLPVEEFRRLAHWMRERDHALWDQQLDNDSSLGKADFLFEEAENERKEGSLRDWPTTQ